MNLRKIYAALLTADLSAAENWYTKLFGRGPDHRPMDTLLDTRATWGWSRSGMEEAVRRVKCRSLS
jgi:hypothetical protein